MILKAISGFPEVMCMQKTKLPSEQKLITIQSPICHCHECYIGMHYSSVNHYHFDSVILYCFCMEWFFHSPGHSVTCPEFVALPKKPLPHPHTNDSFKTLQEKWQGMAWDCSHCASVLCMQVIGLHGLNRALNLVSYPVTPSVTYVLYRKEPCECTAIWTIACSVQCITVCAFLHLVKAGQHKGHTLVCPYMHVFNWIFSVAFSRRQHSTWHLTDLDNLRGNLWLYLHHSFMLFLWSE